MGRRAVLGVAGSRRRGRLYSSFGLETDII